MLLLLLLLTNKYEDDIKKVMLCRHCVVLKRQLNSLSVYTILVFICLQWKVFL